MARLRILAIVSSARIGGAERHVAVLTRGLARRGHEVMVLCPPGGWLGEFLRAENVPVVEAPFRGRGALGTVKTLWNLMRSFQPSVVHTHLTGAAYIGLPVSLLRHVPMIASVHNVLGAAYRPANGGLRYRVSRAGLRLPRNTDWIFHAVARRGGTLVAVSEFVRKMLVQDGIPQDRIRVVCHGTEYADLPVPALDLTVRSEFGFAGESLVIGVVGRVCRQKGQMLAVEAVARLRRELRERARLLLIGAVDPSFGGCLEEAIKSHGLDGNVVLAGERKDVRRLLSCVDVGLHPSMAEACPLAILEQLAAGRPMIATRVGGAVELFEDGEGGLLVEPDASDISSALDRLMSNPEERRRMGLAARAAVEERFTVSRMLSDYEQLYDSRARVSADRRAG